MLLSAGQVGRWARQNCGYPQQQAGGEPTRQGWGPPPSVVAEINHQVMSVHRRRWAGVGSTQQKVKAAEGSWGFTCRRQAGKAELGLGSRQANPGRHKLLACNGSKA